MDGDGCQIVHYCVGWRNNGQRDKIGRLSNNYEDDSNQLENDTSVSYLIKHLIHI